MEWHLCRADELNDDTGEIYNKNIQIKFKIAMLQVMFMWLQWCIVIFKICLPFTDCINELKNTEVDNAKQLDIIIPMYNLLKYGGNYSKTSGILF